MKSVKLVFDCAIGNCPVGSDPDYDCAYICSHCKLCTSDGMVITKVKKGNIVYEVVGVSGDEFFFLSHNPKSLYSMGANIEKFNKEFEIIETQFDNRADYYNDY